MKLNTRTLFIVAGLAVVAAANANVVIGFAYGDATTAAANGAAVGAKIADGATIKIGAIGTTFSLQVWAFAPTEELKYSSGSLFVGIDKANTGTAGFADLAEFNAARTEKKLSFSTGWVDYNPATIALKKSSNGAAGTGTISEIGAALTGSFGAGTSMRSIGSWAAYQFKTGYYYTAAAGSGLYIG